jgi:hypothetical protein
MSEFRDHCAQTIMIPNKNGELVPFILNEAQEKLAELLLPLAFTEDPRPIVVVIHKARQEGISVFLAAFEKFVSSKKPRLSTVHLLPTDDLAVKFYDQKMLPILEGSHPDTLPEISVSTKPSPYLRFKNLHDTELKSFIKIGGSRSRAAGRSGTHQIVIFDEYAFYEQVDNLERGVLATLPRDGFSLTVYVSTANGVNHFHDAVKIARKPESKIHYLFLPWHMLKEYEKEPEGRLSTLDQGLTEYELFLLDIFEKEGYPPETWARKLEFYSYTLQVEAKNDESYMKENYPSTSEESFEATGAPVLPSNVLMKWRESPQSFDYIEPFTIPGSRNEIEFRTVDRSTIKRYQEPIPRRRYYLAIDPSTGEEAGDATAGFVLDEQTMEEVCTFNEVIDQTDLAVLAVQIAKYYNGAIIIPERNMGRTLIDWIRLQIGYSRLYVDPYGSSRTKAQYGIHMTRPVKNEAIQRMRFFMNNGIWKTSDIGFIDDALHFSWQKTPGGFQRAAAQGSNDAGQPYHDDTVMARLTLCAALDMRRWRAYSQKPKK